jgi:hypothetical protein
MLYSPHLRVDVLSYLSPRAWHLLFELHVDLLLSHHCCSAVPSPIASVCKAQQLPLCLSPSVTKGNA